MRIIPHSTPPAWQYTPYTRVKEPAELLAELEAKYPQPRGAEPVITWIAQVGHTNAEWLAGDDSPLAGNAVQAKDNGDGTVTLDERAYFMLRGLAVYEDGYTERTERTGPVEARMWIEGDPYPVVRVDI